MQKHQETPRTEEISRPERRRILISEPFYLETVRQVENQYFRNRAEQVGTVPLEAVTPLNQKVLRYFLDRPHPPGVDPQFTPWRPQMETFLAYTGIEDPLEAYQALHFAVANPATTNMAFGVLRYLYRRGELFVDLPREEQDRILENPSPAQLAGLCHDVDPEEFSARVADWRDRERQKLVAVALGLENPRKAVEMLIRRMETEGSAHFSAYQRSQWEQAVQIAQIEALKPDFDPHAPLSPEILVATKQEAIYPESEQILPALLELSLTLFHHHPDQIRSSLPQEQRFLEQSVLDSLDALESSWVLGMDESVATEQLLQVLLYLHEFVESESLLPSQQVVERILGPEGLLARKCEMEQEVILETFAGFRSGNRELYSRGLEMAAQLQAIGRVCAYLDWDQTASLVIDGLQSDSHAFREAMALILADSFLDFADGQREASLEGDGTFSSWGKKIQLAGFPDEGVRVVRLAYDRVGILDEAGCILGFAALDPLRLPRPDQSGLIATRFEPISLEAFSARPGGRGAARAPEELRQGFIESFQQTFDPGGEFQRRSGLRVDPRLLPFELKFQIYHYLVTHETQDQERLYQHIGRYGVRAAYPLAALEFGDQAGEVVLNLGEQVWERKQGNEVELLKRLFEIYASIDGRAGGFALNAGLEGANLEIIKELIMRRAKSFLIAASESYQQPDVHLSLEDLIKAMELYEIALEKRLSGSGKIYRPGAQAMDADEVAEYYFRHRDNPEAMGVCGAIFESEWLKAMEQQGQTEYAQKIVDLTKEFYKAYRLIPVIERDKNVDTEADIERFSNFIKWAIEHCGLEDGWQGGALFCGDLSRVEIHVFQRTEEMRAKPGHWNGIDLLEPAVYPIQPPDNFVFYEANLNDPPEELRGQLDIAIGPGSGICDVVMDEDLSRMLTGLNQMLKMDGVAAFDEAFPYGIHSHHKLVEDYHAEHPDEPWGTLQFPFQTASGETVDKVYRMRRPERVIEILEQHGFKVITIPNYDDIQSLREGESDDRFGGEIFDPIGKPLYLARSNKIRWTIIIQKVAEVEDVEGLISQLSVGKTE